jgi:hypothetical protein
MATLFFIIIIPYLVFFTIGLIMSRYRLFYTILYLSFLIILGLSSCSPEYIPNLANTPMFDEKGEIQANVTGGVSGTDIQGAYALSDNIGVMVNTSFNNETSDTSEDYHKHQIYELALGYYGDISDYGRFEVYGGFGTGNIKAYNENLEFDNPRSDATFTRLFVQPSLGMKSDIFDGNLATRLAIVKVNYAEEIDGQEEKFKPFIEPVLTGRLGYKYVKLVSQIGLSIPLTQDYVFDHQPFIFSLGLHFNINPIKTGSSE